ncbi:MAG: glycosyltransferase [Sulfurimonas sp.]|nr:glycosyltransferase [Sulfurimonas sp.]
MKKISILIYSLSKGGAERVISILLNELKDKFDITLVLMNETIKYKIPKEQKIIYLEKLSIYENGFLKLTKLPALAFKYKKICKENNIEVSLSFMNRANYINILSSMFGNRIKTIISERAMPSLQHKNGLQGIINRFLIKTLYNKADTVIANSRGNTLDLQNSFNIKNIVTINNPVSSQHSHIKSKNDRFTFIAVGRLDRGKNHQLIINAIKNIDASLLIIGDGALKDELQKQITDLKLQDRVFLLGEKSDPFKYLLEADCFVFSSNYEGFPNVVLEALSCGLPVISTDCKSGPREILAPKSDINYQIKDEIELAEYGILTPINSILNMKKSMNLIINDNILLQRYETESKKRAKCFSVNIIIEQYANIISQEKRGD